MRIEYAEVVKDGSKRTYISVIENLSRSAPVLDDPFPAVEDFPPDESGSYGPDTTTLPDAPGSPPAAIVDKDHSIVRQCCIKAAGMALQHTTGNAEEKAGQLTYLAGVLEDWCWR